MAITGFRGRTPIQIAGSFAVLLDFLGFLILDPNPWLSSSGRFLISSAQKPSLNSAQTACAAGQLIDLRDLYGRRSNESDRPACRGEHFPQLERPGAEPPDQ